MIVLNVLAVVLQTVKALNDRYETVFYCFETASVAVFSVEYILQVDLGRQLLALREERRRL